MHILSKVAYFLAWLFLSVCASSADDWDVSNAGASISRAECWCAYYPEPTALVQYEQGAFELLQGLINKNFVTLDPAVQKIAQDVLDEIACIAACIEGNAANEELLRKRDGVPFTLAEKALHYTYCDLIVALCPRLENVEKIRPFSVQEEQQRLAGVFCENARGFTVCVATAPNVQNAAFDYLYRVRGGAVAGALFAVYQDYFSGNIYEDGFSNNNLGYAGVTFVQKGVTLDDFLYVRGHYQGYYESQSLELNFNYFKMLVGADG